MKNTMTTKRIGEGVYLGTYKGQEVKIVRDFYEYCNETVWYAQINGEEVHDVVSKKRYAIEDAMYMIDNPKEYGIELK
jgi:hypothetical protein